jgi:hypothetical protein
MDLRDHAYVSAIVRVILVAALIVAIHPIWALIGGPEELGLAFAFVLGCFRSFGIPPSSPGRCGDPRTVSLGEHRSVPIPGKVADRPAP